jgi:hypothetical protein
VEQKLMIVTTYRDPRPHRNVFQKMHHQHDIGREDGWQGRNLHGKLRQSDVRLEPCYSEAFGGVERAAMTLGSGDDGEAFAIGSKACHEAEVVQKHKERAYIWMAGTNTLSGYCISPADALLVCNNIPLHVGSCECAEHAPQGSFLSIFPELHMLAY